MQLSGQLPDHDVEVGVRHVLSSFSKSSRHIGARDYAIAKGPWQLLVERHHHLRSGRDRCKVKRIARSR
jgi:hypothetical protein